MTSVIDASRVTMSLQVLVLLVGPAPALHRRVRTSNLRRSTAIVLSATTSIWIHRVISAKVLRGIPIVFILETL